MLANGEADEQLAEFEEGRGDGSAQPDVAPGDIGVRQSLQHPARHHDRVLGPLREIGGELVLKSGCQFAHETARGAKVTAEKL